MAEKKRLTAKAIAEADDIETREIDVEAWGGTVLVKGFTKEQVDRIRKQSTTDGEVDQAKLEQHMLAEGMIEPKMTVAEVAALGKRSWRGYYVVLNAVMEVSGLTEEFTRQAKRSFRASS